MCCAMVRRLFAALLVAPALLGPDAVAAPPAGAPFGGVQINSHVDEAVALLRAGNPAFQFSGSYVDWTAGRVAGPGLLTLAACDGVAAGPRCDPPAGDRNYEWITLGFSASSGRVVYASHVWFPALGRAPAFADIRDRALQWFPGTPQLIGQQHVRATDVFGKPDLRCLRAEPRVVAVQGADPDCGESLALTILPAPGGEVLAQFVGVCWRRPKIDPLMAVMPV